MPAPAPLDPAAAPPRRCPDPLPLRGLPPTAGGGERPAHTAVRPRPSALAVAAVLAMAAAFPAPAAALEAGSRMLSLAAVVGPGDFAVPEGAYLLPLSATQVGLAAEGWLFFTDGVGLAVSGAYHRNREVEEAPGAPDRGRTLEAWSARLGLDRFVELEDGVFLFMGPGIEVWRGRAVFRESLGPGEAVGPRAWRVSGSGRIGGLLVLSDSVGLLGHVGARLGPAWAGEGEVVSRWYAGGLEGGAGVVIAF